MLSGVVLSGVEPARSDGNAPIKERCCYNGCEQGKRELYPLDEVNRHPCVWLKCCCERFMLPKRCPKATRALHRLPRWSEDFCRVRGAEWTREQESLAQLASEIRQRLALLRKLDSLSDR